MVTRTLTAVIHKEATELCLEEFPQPEITRPLMTTFEAAKSHLKTLDF